MQVSEASKSLEVEPPFKISQFDDGTRRALQIYRGILLTVMKKGIGNAFGMHHKSTAQSWYGICGNAGSG